MRCCLAILKDSFREALASRVLLVTLAGIVAVLVVLSPFGLETSVSTELRHSELTRPERLLKRLTEGVGEQGTPAAHIWSLLSDEQRDQVNDLQNPDQYQSRRRHRGPPPHKRRLINLLNELLEHPEFYDSDSWANSVLSDEVKQLIHQGSLTDTEQKQRNLLLLAVAFPSAIDIIDSTAISLTYGTAVVQGPIPLTPTQFEFVAEQVLIAVVGVFLGFIGVFGCLLVTAGLIPRTFEPEEIALLLSKPVSRSLLFVLRFLGGCVFTLVYSTLLVVGIWMLLGLRMDLWRHELLCCIPVYVFLFMIYYAVSAVAGAVWRNSIVALSLVVVFWLVLTVVGVTREALKQHLFDQRGIREIVQAGSHLITIDGEQKTWLWDNGMSAWQEVFQEPSGGLGALTQMFLGTGAQLSPVYDVAGDRILALQQTPSRFGGTGASQLVSASRDGGWERVELARVPDFVPAVLMTSEGRIILPAREAIYEFSGRSEESRQRSEFLSKISGGLLGRTSDGFKEIHPADLPDLGETFAAALDPLSDDLLLYGSGQLHRLSTSDEGRYTLTQSRTFETDSGGVLATTGDFVLLAFSDGRILVVDRESLETVDEMQLEDGIGPQQCAASGDGAGLALLTHEGTLVLFDVNSRQLRMWSHPDVPACSSVAWSSDHNLMVADGRLRVQEYDVQQPDMDPVHEWSEPETWVYQLYDYMINPAWTVLPKPSQLDQFVEYVMTRDESSTGNERPRPQSPFNDGDRLERVASFDPVPVLRDNAIFVTLLLAFGCLYISRRDF